MATELHEAASREIGTPRLLSGLSFFFPAHNEEPSVPLLIEEALAVLPQVSSRFEIICVDDGSTDGTASAAREIAGRNPSVRLVSHPVNRGYGAALKSGIEHSSMPWIFFTDGDRQFRLDALPAFAAAIEDEHDAILGYRLRRSDPWHRSLNARLYKMMIRLVLRLKVRDVDCAYKLLPASLVKSVVLQSEGALISAELLVRLENAGAHFKEIGVQHYPREAGVQSGAKLTVILRMFRELFGLAAELRRGHPG